MRRAVLPFLLAALAIVATVAVRVGWSSREALALGAAAEAAGDLDEARTQYQYAMRWYLPLTSAPVEAADALARLADAARAAGDAAAEMAALRRLRGGIFATRSFFGPFDGRQADVDARLAHLSAQGQLAAGLGRGQEEAALEAEHRRLLGLDPTPNAGLAFLATLGFLGWIAAGFGLIFRGLDADLRLVQPAAGRFFGLFVSCFGAWIVGLWLA